MKLFQAYVPLHNTREGILILVYMHIIKYCTKTYITLHKLTQVDRACSCKAYR